ncbi:MAG TPA: ATP-binding cassette domain-containing protein, partial [Limnochordia bacterium]|nr:ATP-binding cassette domain-containing protein [Limnochordia bacterium]
MSGKQSVEPSGDLLEVSGLAVEAGGRTILHPTDLNLGAGEWKAIVGPNGAGKSTLLKALATLVPYRGSIR